MPYVEDVKFDGWQEVFRTTCDSKLFKIIILGCYKEDDFWEKRKNYRARVTLSLYPYENGVVKNSTGSYLANEDFKTEREAIDWLIKYSQEAAAEGNWSTKWEKF